MYAGFLPDSMSMVIEYPYVVAEFFGGWSDTMIQKVLWNGEVGEYLMIMPHTQLIYTAAPDDTLRGLTVVPGKKKLSLLGQPCTEVSVKYQGSSWKETYYVSDSITFPKMAVDSSLKTVSTFFASRGSWDSAKND